MNQPAFQEENSWESSSLDNDQEKILESWKSSKEAPGKYLKQLRELQQRSLKEMATELGVSVNQLQALENDNKDELPAPIYIKSYTKRYCLALGIREEDVASVLNDMAKDVLPTLNRVSIRQNMSSRLPFMRLVGYGIALVFIVMLVLSIKSMDFSGLKNFVSPSTGAEESTATELSLPVIVDEAETEPK